MDNFTSAWGWPQWTMVVGMTLGLIIQAAYHGKPREAFSFPIGLVSFGLNLFILICGGFFS